MSETKSAAEALVPGIRFLMEKAVAEATEAAIKKATEDFEMQLRKAIGTTAIEVSRYFEVYTEKDNLVITVKVPKGA